MGRGDILEWNFPAACKSIRLSVQDTPPGAEEHTRAAYARASPSIHQSAISPASKEAHFAKDRGKHKGENRYPRPEGTELPKAGPSGKR